MTKESRDILLRQIGVLDGLFYQAPREIQDAIECIVNNLEHVLKTEEGICAEH